MKQELSEHTRIFLEKLISNIYRFSHRCWRQTRDTRNCRCILNQVYIESGNFYSLSSNWGPFDLLVRALVAGAQQYSHPTSFSNHLPFIGKHELLVATHRTSHHKAGQANFLKGLVPGGTILLAFQSFVFIN